ncbi:AGAP012092-PA, partial [Anopheles gambiae str. PEST]
MESLAKTTDECKMESLAKATDECNEQLKASSLQDKPSPSRKQEAVSVDSGDQHKRDQMTGYDTLKQIGKKHRAERFSLGDLKKEYSTVFEQTVQLCGTQVPFGKLFAVYLEKHANYETSYCNCNVGDTEVSLSVALRILDKFNANPTENELDFILDEHIFVQRTLTRRDER